MDTHFINICTKNIRTCVFCDLPANNSDLNICHGCFEDLPWLINSCSICALPLSSVATNLHCKQCIDDPPIYNKTFAAFNYQFPINLLMPAIKSNNNSHHINWMASCLSSIITQNRQHSLPEVIIPTPTSRKKLLRKGFNQIDLLALKMHQRLAIEVDYKLVHKIRDTKAQADLPAQERKRNLIDAFVAKKNNYRHVAIIDDVMTTGSTMNEISKALKQSGIEKIDIWIIARTPL